MLRTVDGRLVPGPPIASSDEELEQLLRSIGARSDGGQTSREFSSASPVLNVRLKGVTALGARLQAAMDVLRAYRVFMGVDATVRARSQQGDHDSASHLALGAQEGQLSNAFARVDAALGRDIAAIQNRFDLMISLA